MPTTIYQEFPNAVLEPATIEKKSNKVKGKEATVENLELEDLRKLINYFQNPTVTSNNKGSHWLYFLCLSVQATLGRRNSDVINLRWCDIFNPIDGSYRKHVEMVEKKTSKYANPLVSRGLKKAIEIFTTNTGVNPADNHYQNPIFMRYFGSKAGQVMSYDAYYKALKRAAKTLDIQYDVGTHSARKTFGAVSNELHSDDNDRLTVIQEIFNHSDSKTTNRYIGITRRKKDQFYEDFGDWFSESVLEEEVEVAAKAQLPEVNTELLEALIKEAYCKGADSAQKSLEEKLNEMSELLEKVKQLTK